MPETDGRFADFLRIGQQARAIECRRGAGDDESVWHAAGLEGAAPERAQLKRTVGQFVVVRRLVGAEALRVDLERRQPRGH